MIKPTLSQPKVVDWGTLNRNDHGTVAVRSGLIGALMGSSARLAGNRDTSRSIRRAAARARRRARSGGS